MTTRTPRFFLRTGKGRGAGPKDNFISTATKGARLKIAGSARGASRRGAVSATKPNYLVRTVGSYGPLITVIRRHSDRGHHVPRNGRASG